MKFLPFLILLGLLSFLSSCIGGPEIKPAFSVDGKRVVVIPFMQGDLYFLESKTGNEIATLVSQILARQGVDTKVVNPAKAFDLIRGKDPREIQWDKVASIVDADYVITGDITTFRARDPKKDVNCYRGRAAIQVTAWRKDNTLAFSGVVGSAYPRGRFSAPVLSMFDATEAEVLNKIKIDVALRVAQLFYPHPPEEEF